MGFSQDRFAPPDQMEYTYRYANSPSSSRKQAESNLLLQEPWGAAATAAERCKRKNRRVMSGNFTRGPGHVVKLGASKIEGSAPLSSSEINQVIENIVGGCEAKTK